MHTLIVHEAFLNSSVLPKECLFTGRTDNLKQSVLFLRGNAPHPDNPQYKPFCSFPILILHTRGRFFLWRLLQRLRYLWLAGGILVGVVAILAAIFFFTDSIHNPQSYPGSLGLLLGFIAYGVIAWGLHWFCRRQTVTIAMQSANGLILLRFPSHLEQTARHYLDAYNRFLAAHSVAPVQLASDDEAWQDTVGADWDQIKTDEKQHPRD